MAKISAGKSAGQKKGTKLVATGIAFVLFVLYMIPFVLVLINSFKQKVNIIKNPLSLVDTAGLQFSNYVDAFIEIALLWHYYAIEERVIK